MSDILDDLKMMADHCDKENGDEPCDLGMLLIRAIAEIRKLRQQPVGEVGAVDGIPVPTGHAEADRLIGRLMSSDPDYDDCADAAALIQREIKGPDGFDTWREAALAERIKRTQQPFSAAEVPMPEHVEQLAITRYRPVPNGMFGYKVVAGDGTRSVFEGTKSECTLIARKLTEAFLDGAHVAGDAPEAAGYARGKAENAKDAERYRWLRDGNDRKESAAMRIALHCYGMEWDAAIDAALRGEVK